MSKEEEMIETLVKGGVIGAALGALVTNNKNGAMLGALAGAAIAASLQANENAEKTNVPMVIEENGKLYKILPGGERKFIRSLNKSTKRLPKNFRLS
jgi:hypothetical protein